VSNGHLFSEEMDAMVSAVLACDAAPCVDEPAPVVSRDGERTVVWLDGEQDIATVVVLRDALARVVSADDSDLIVDLSGVTFLSVATLDELVLGRNILLGQSRNLTLRSPSRLARRLLDLCGLADLVEPGGLANLIVGVSGHQPG
jgi:anti-anti-sigma factor